MFKSKSKSKKQRRTYKIIVGGLSIICSVVITVLIVHLFVRAGDLDPSAAPGDTMKTLDDIYSAMTIDTTATEYDEDSPGAAASTMHTLQEIYNKAVNFPLPDTGQVTCYNADGDAITCGDAPVGQDAEYDSANSFICDLSYTDNSDGTVTDNCTGLMWKKCTEPDTSTTTCGGMHLSSIWVNTFAACEALNDPGFAGYTDWRLPNAKELFSIVLEEYPAIDDVKEQGAPYINQTVFPNTVSNPYWSSTTSPDDTATALFVHFNYGYVSYYGKTSWRYVRCVRGQ